MNSGRSLAAAAVLLLGGCNKPKGDPRQAVETFLQEISAGKTAEAYHQAAFHFQAAQTEPAFAGTVQEMGLTGVAVPKLDPLEIEGRTAKANVTLVTKDGQKLALVFTMQWESGAWRIFSLKSPRDAATGLVENRFSLLGKTSNFKDAFEQPLPSDKTVRSIVKDSMAQFAIALRTQSFHSFYEHVSLAWQNGLPGQAGLTEKQLKAAFQGFIDQKVDVTGASDLEPVFTQPPQMTTGGLLLCRGHFPTQPIWVSFTFTYIYELPEWKLFGIDVYFEKPAGTP